MKQELRFLRPAIAMIELIFAIVVMGIVMMSAPMLISTANQSGYTAIQQEGISEAATQMSIMMDYPWDENNTNGSYDATVLNVTSGDSELNGAPDGSLGGLRKRRAGTPRLSSRLYISYNGSEFNASTIGFDIGEVGIADIDDIDDFNNTTVNLNQIVASTADYIEKGAKISITRTVTYMKDAATYPTPVGGTLAYTPNFANAIPTTNIKRLQVTLTSIGDVAELSKTITLHAFSCNIGTYELKEQ